MTTHAQDFDSFEAFWPHFLSSHQNPLTRWGHVVGLSLGLTGAALALRHRSVLPLALGLGAAIGLAVGVHPLIEGNTPENFGRPIWAARAFLRMCLRTVSGSIEQEIADLSNASATQ